MGKKKTLFDESLVENNNSFINYISRLTELGISMFEWKNLPETVDPRYIELNLFKKGSMIFFNDDVIGDLCLPCLSHGNFDVYGEPILRTAYSDYNQFNTLLKNTNSVIIWNNMLRTNTYPIIVAFARRLAAIDRIIDVNANAQKTPVLVQGTDKQRLTLINLYKEYDGNAPFIFGDRDMDLHSLKALTTDAPYVCDKLYELKTQIWNEALTFLGIANINTYKKERMITDEVTRNLGGTIASRYSRLESRKNAVKKINKMFGTNIEVEYREDYDDIEGGDVNE